MKKIIFILLIFLTSCTTHNEYQYKLSKLQCYENFAKYVGTTGFNNTISISSLNTKINNPCRYLQGDKWDICESKIIEDFQMTLDLCIDNINNY